MIKVGVIGLGMMGSTHLDAYGKRDDVTIAAISDMDEDRLHGRSKAAGNIEGQAQGGVDLSKAKKYTDGKALIADPEVQIVDICLQTQQHLEFATAALDAGKHVLLEKPVCRTFGQARELVEAVGKAKTFLMVAMCMRFWPGWDWLKTAIDAGTYGAVKSTVFRRVSGHPGGPFYGDHEKCGGAILDLHVHDTDFVNHLFGMPQSVHSVGYSKVSGGTDHVVTHYHYPAGKGAPLVVAEGGWAMQDGFAFSMSYMANFEKATAVFDLAAQNPLTVYQAGKATPIKLAEGMGYDHEIGYFVECVKSGKAPTRVTVEQAATSIRIVEAEMASVKTGQTVRLDS